MTINNKNMEDIREIFRAFLLAALDAAARKTFGVDNDQARFGRGATDADLPRLFAALDIQIDALVKRYQKEPTP